MTSVNTSRTLGRGWRWRTKTSLRMMLDRIGRPEDIAAEEMTDLPTSQLGRFRRRRWLYSAAVVFVAVGTALGVWLSSGPAKARIPVPTVLGLQESKAQARLASIGLRVRVRAVRFQAPRGTVVAEVPALASLTEGATVTLFTSLGPPIVLPNVLNDRVSVAVATLERAGLVPVVEQISRPFPVRSRGCRRDSGSRLVAVRG